MSALCLIIVFTVFIVFSVLIVPFVFIVLIVIIVLHVDFPLCVFNVHLVPCVLSQMNFEFIVLARTLS